MIMLSESDKNIIIKFAQKYKVSAIYLFGSSLNANAQARDIDLGVQGIEPTLFFKFYGELSRQLSKEVDLVDLSHQSLFNALVKKKGLKIYG
jgi:predicted nucleotidyltransferase